MGHLCKWPRAAQRDPYPPYASRRSSEYWMPGEAIPISVNRPGSPDSPLRSQQSVIDVLQVFQSSMDKHLSVVCEKLETINSRMTVLETRQKTLEEEIQSSASCSSSNHSTPQNGRQRKRLTPVALQVFKFITSCTGW